LLSVLASVRFFLFRFFFSDCGLFLLPDAMGPISANAVSGERSDSEAAGCHSIGGSAV
jgi:hypothetical protein